MAEKIAILSNVNITPVVQALERLGIESWEPPGYGNVLGALLNQSSGLEAFDPTDILILMDIDALLQASTSKIEAEDEIRRWFSMVGDLIPEGPNVYISEAACNVDPYFGDRKSDPARYVEAVWNQELFELANCKANVFVFPLSTLVIEVGAEQFFNRKMWYLARMPYSSKAYDAITAKMVDVLTGSERRARKVLAIDLDNTIWGGVVGEMGSQGVTLSDEHLGLAYKEAQRAIKAMRKAGVVICVVSKNNFEDAIEVFRTNRSMVLNESDIALFKINWERKDCNLRELAEELNLGLDSFVFLDDNPVERSLVGEMLPEVAVVDFPDDPTDLPEVLRHVYECYFKQERITKEDEEKTEQYKANSMRKELERASATFDDYLDSLDIEIRQVDAISNIERISQLVGKTNQFNLTTKRYSRAQLEEMISSSDYEVYAFNVADRFGDNGLTAVAIVELLPAPEIDTFLMSCRIMGKGVEVEILDFLESSLEDRGYPSLDGVFVPTQKNVPVKNLYTDLGYEPVLFDEEENDGKKKFRLALTDRPKRRLHAKGLKR